MLRAGEAREARQMAAEEVRSILTDALEAVRRASTVQHLEDVRVAYLGKKGRLTLVLRSLGQMPAGERPKIGQAVNSAKDEIEAALAEKGRELSARELEERLMKESVDVTMPGRPVEFGHVHPITAGFAELFRIFTGMGFEVVQGPEVESDYYNFEALNTPKFHPARDIQDTFYITENILLRTQTSPMQVRTMEMRRPPVRIVAPGKVYRSDALDATHSPVFHQLEGLVVDQGITFGDLKGTLTAFAKAFYGEDRAVRFRPHYFPFTEPSAEMDVSCAICRGRGCRMCGGTGWIEVLGAGMVHPRVLEMAGYDPEEVTGFAFGFGVDRMVLLKHGIDDIRLLFENDIRFLQQFS